MDQNKINIADLQQLNVAILKTIKQAFNDADDGLNMSEFVNALKRSHQQEFEKLKEAIGQNHPIAVDQDEVDIQKKKRTSANTSETLQTSGNVLENESLEMFLVTQSRSSKDKKFQA